MTDEELVARLREPWFTNGCERYQLDAADRIEDLAKQLARSKAQRNRIKNTLVNLLLSADSGDQEEIAWAIQLVRDDIAREGDPVNDRG
jgi:hypothetical protein